MWLYTNQFKSGIYYDNNMKHSSVFKEEDSLYYFKEHDLDDIQDSLVQLKEILRDIKDTVGEYRIFASYFRKNPSGKYSSEFIYLVFEKFVSCNYINTVFSKVYVEFSKDYYRVYQGSVEEPTGFEYEIKDNIIELKNISSELSVEIVNLQGKLLNHFNISYRNNFSIDMQNYTNGVYMVLVNNYLIKFSKVR